ncbi:VC0807 family protein [Nocardia australiensis]|uniref:VC0807 family protein n=1 Tax=Nocardia australiensis TaxID=2887191 RepID=UPI001D154FB9|nr:VC0807 family protein [Nocardia australiensis]
MPDNATTHPIGGTSTSRPGDATSIATVRPMALIRSLAPDLVLPLVIYYALHLLGVGDTVALLAATALSAVRIVWGAVRERSLNPFATVMFIAFGVGAALALISGDPQFMLLKNSFITGAVGLVFLATALRGRPISLAAVQTFDPSRSAQFTEQYRVDPRIRHGHRVSTTVSGTVLVLESLLRIPLVYLLPVSVGVGVGEVLLIATLSGLTLWNVVYLRRARRARAAQAFTSLTSRPPLDDQPIAR